MTDEADFRRRCRDMRDYYEYRLWVAMREYLAGTGTWWSVRFYANRLKAMVDVLMGR